MLPTQLGLRDYYKERYGDDGVSFITASAVSDLPPRDPSPIWRYDPQVLVLRLACPPGPYPYEVDLERCNTSAQVLDRLTQIFKKTWCTPEIFCHLMYELNRVLWLQENLCGSGQHHRLNVKRHCRRRINAEGGER